MLTFPLCCIWFNSLWSRWFCVGITFGTFFSISPSRFSRVPGGPGSSRLAGCCCPLTREMDGTILLITALLSSTCNCRAFYLKKKKDFAKQI